MPFMIAKNITSFARYRVQHLPAIPGWGRNRLLGKNTLCRAGCLARQITIRATTDLLNVTWDDGDQSSYPFIYLRDNCQCQDCFHPTALQRTCHILDNYSVHIRPVSTQSDENAVTMEWEDGHRSLFPFKWLRERRFPKTEKEIRSRSDCGLKSVTWGSELAGRIPKYHFDDVLQDDASCLSWLETLATKGLTLLKKAPKTVDTLSQIANRLQCSFFPTHYGEVYTIQNKAGANNVAYTSKALSLHTDLTYYQQRPGIQLLHCIEQCNGKGGENYLVDGFKVAEDFRIGNPNAFDLLSTIKITFGDIGADELGQFFKITEQTIISLNSFGEVDGIFENGHTRGSVINAPAERVKDFYEAYTNLIKTFNHAENLVIYKMEEGDTLVFNNNRVLHGRSGFTSTSPRHLQGCYLTWDEVYSAIRVLRLNLGHKDYF